MPFFVWHRCRYHLQAQFSKCAYTVRCPPCASCLAGLQIVGIHSDYRNLCVRAKNGCRAGAPCDQRWVHAASKRISGEISGSFSASGTRPLSQGWSLVAVGDKPTPLSFNNSLCLSPPAIAGGHSDQCDLDVGVGHSNTGLVLLGTEPSECGHAEQLHCQQGVSGLCEHAGCSRGCGVTEYWGLG